MRIDEAERLEFTANGLQERENLMQYKYRKRSAYESIEIKRDADASRRRREAAAARPGCKTVSPVCNGQGHAGTGFVEGRVQNETAIGVR